MSKATAVFTTLLVAATAHLQRHAKPPRQPTPPGTGEPLLLSKLPPKAIREASQVVLPGWGHAGHSGFFTTNAAATNHMFWWYFPKEGAPLLVWLQGGPGGSSLFGLFAEMGPFNSDASLKLIKRAAGAWTDKYAMLFIDNPVGAGFSFTTSDDGYCNNTKTCVSENLYSLLQQFNAAFPEAMDEGLYVTGESYGGHYVPGISAYIHKENSRLRQGAATRGAAVLPLRGMAIGDGWIDPVHMVPAYPAMLANLGLCDAKERAVIQDYCDRTVSLIQSGQMKAAFDVWDQMLNGDVWRVLWRYLNSSSVSVPSACSHPT